MKKIIKSINYINIYILYLLLHSKKKICVIKLFY